VKTERNERELITVPETARRRREARWNWVERTVWTERMLHALVNGVKGGKWYSLMDKVSAEATIRIAFDRVKANRGGAGVDGVSIARFEKGLEHNLAKLCEELKTGCYKPRAVKRTLIDKPGSREKRPLGIPTVRDRVVQTALKIVLEPIFEREYSESSYGFRPNRGCKDALRAVMRHLKEGKRWVVDADIRKYFDTIPGDRLIERVKERISDRRVLALLESYLNQEVIQDLKRWTPEAGTPQGAVISPLLANIYLNPLDHQLEERDLAMVRYADDLVIMCESEEEARSALAALERWTEQEGLRLHPEKTLLVDMSHPGASFDFLGYHFEVSKKRPETINRWPAKKAQKRLREKLRPLTKRNNGRSMEATIRKINPILEGWFEYFKHSKRTEFPNVDGWVRMRLRSILRKRKKLRGRGRGNDHIRWPNSHFARLGLFSTEAAHRVMLLQPSRS